MSTINVEIVTPEKLLCSASAEMAIIPGEEGYMGILPNHVPLISNLQPGIVELRAAAGNTRYFVAEGFVEVSTDRCTVLTKNALDVTTLSGADVDGMIADKKALLNQAYKEEDVQSLESDVAFLTTLSEVLAQNTH